MSGAGQTLVRRAFSMPKAGNSDAQNDDAVAISPDGALIAVADGVSDAYDPGMWARQLTADFVETNWTTHGDDRVSAYLDGVARRWHESLRVDDLPWFKQEKAARGAACTFLGLALSADGERRAWTALVTGDTCLFQLDRDRVVAAIPFTDAADFGLTPQALRSVTGDGAGNTLTRHHGSFEPGDTFLIATDALAAHFIERAAAGDLDWGSWLAITSQEAFEERIRLLRERHEMRNDDTTLAVIAVPGVPAAATRRPAVALTNSGARPGPKPAPDRPRVPEPRVPDVPEPEGHVPEPVLVAPPHPVGNAMVGNVIVALFIAALIAVLAVTSRDFSEVMRGEPATNEAPAGLRPGEAIFGIAS